MLNYVQANIHSLVSGHQVASSFESNHSTVSLLNQFVWIQMTSLKQSDTVEVILFKKPKTKQKQAALIFNVELEELQQSPTVN